MAKQLTNLSHRAHERNMTTPKPTPIPEANKTEPKDSKKWKARIRVLGETPSATFNTFHKTAYCTGDGDIITERRPGSMVAFSLPSVGQRC